LPGPTSLFDEQFVQLFEEQFPSLRRFLDRLSGEPDLAADLAQEAFVRLYRRGSLPDAPGAWLVTVAMNLFRNTKTTQSRRSRLLKVVGDSPADLDPPDAAIERDSVRRRVRAIVDGLPERERQLLLLQAEGYSYRDIASVLQLQETSVGTLLARARRAFRALYEGGSDAS
jgi:RNA polymerase sigma-70 factor, ECF subfamily